MSDFRGQFVTISGLKDVVDALRALPKELSGDRGGPVRRALYKASKIIRDDAERRAPRLTGNLAANIYLYRDRNPRSSTGAAERFVIGVRTKKHRYSRTNLNRRLGRIGRFYRTRGDAYYWWFVEFGIGNPNYPKQPFLRPAFEEHKSGAVSTFAAELGLEVEAAARKVRRTTSR